MESIIIGIAIFIAWLILTWLFKVIGASIQLILALIVPVLIIIVLIFLL